MAMKLRAHIQDMGARKALALSVGTSPDYLWQIATNWNGRKPGHSLAKAIEAATFGVVSRHDLRPDIFGPAPAGEGGNG